MHTLALKHVLPICLPARSHPVLLARDLRQATDFLRECAGSRRAVVCTEKALTDLLSAFLSNLREVFPKAARVVFLGGEEQKSRGTKTRLENALFARGVGRDGVLLAVGGGVVTDVVGFTAGTYLRGIPYVNVPTTLVGMVDAALGGKTAVNTPRGKNLVGVVHAPAGVCIALDALETLPDREFRSGLGECLKHGAIADAGFFDWLSRQDVRSLRKTSSDLQRLVETSVRIKMAVVDADPDEHSGHRYILNAGHTVAHALESLSHFRIGHGEAVAAGLCWEAAAAVVQGYLAASDVRRIVFGVRSVGFENRTRSFDAEAVFAAAGWDKKNRGGKVNYVPLGTLGAPALPAPHTCEMTLAALSEGLELLKEL